MLQIDDVSVSFGGIRALDGVSLTAESGRITGLIGPNGAGKTTLFNVITGLQRNHRGRVMLDGTDLTSLSPARRARAGVGRTFQRLEIFGSLGVRDNVLVALENRRLSRHAAREAADRLLDYVGLGAVATTQADILPTGLARLLELARALACEPKVLLLDEPSSGLDPSEGQRLGHLLTDVAARGTAILLVEHDMDLVMRICTRIHVLNFGRPIADGPPERIRSDPAVQAAYLGGAVAVGATRVGQ